MDNARFYVIALLTVIVAAFAVRKVTGCAVRLLVIAAAVAVLALVYYLLVGRDDPDASFLPALFPR